MYEMNSCTRPLRLSFNDFFKYGGFTKNKNIFEKVSSSLIKVQSFNSN